MCVCVRVVVCVFVYIERERERERDRATLKARNRFRFGGGARVTPVYVLNVRAQGCQEVGRGVLRLFGVQVRGLGLGFRFGV